MVPFIALIGFGEAAQAFAAGADWRARATGFDTKTGDGAMDAAFEGLGVRRAATAGEALAGAEHVLSLVTADQALNAAEVYARHLIPGALYCDMNSVAPDTKRAAAAAVEEAGGRYVDVAVMSPVHPARNDAPLLVSGPHARTGAAALAAAGFTNVRVVDGGVGAASSIKMIRSVMIKGIEALTAECMIAAFRVGVVDEVLLSLGSDWPAKTNYNLDRMLVHGARRAAEMDEVVKTLESLGVASPMAQGTMRRQRAAGALGGESPVGLMEKIYRLSLAEDAETGMAV